MPDVILLHPRDNVYVAARNLERGETVTAGERRIELAEPVRQGHKIALAEIGEADVVRKWGETIG
jgi:altronate hydrolase